MGPFLASYEKHNILVIVGYVSKWVETIVIPNNDVKVIVKFLKKNILACFSIPRAIISD